MTSRNFDPQLEALDQRATSRLLTAESFDLNAFTDLWEYLAQKAESIKQDYAISKQVLGSLRNAAKAIRTQAPYVPLARENMALADKFEMLLDLMIIGESPSDRVPGIPRII